MANKRKTLTGEIESLGDAEMALIDLMVKIAIRSRTPIKRRKPIPTLKESEKRFRERDQLEYQRVRSVGVRAAERKMATQAE